MSEGARIPHPFNSLLLIPVYLFQRLFVRVSQVTSSVAILGTLEDAIISHAFNSVFVLGDCAAFII